jgi:hypothetical protein
MVSLRLTVAQDTCHSNPSQLITDEDTILGMAPRINLDIVITIGSTVR